MRAEQRPEDLLRLFRAAELEEQGLKQNAGNRESQQPTDDVHCFRQWHDLSLLHMVISGAAQVICPALVAEAAVFCLFGFMLAHNTGSRSPSGVGGSPRARFCAPISKAICCWAH